MPADREVKLRNSGPTLSFFCEDCVELELILYVETLTIGFDLEGLREALEGALADDESYLSVSLAILATRLGHELGVVSEEPEYDDFSESSLPLDKKFATTQEHRLLLAGGEVARLVREGWSYFGDIDHPNTPNGEWTTDSGPEDRVPDAWRKVCDRIGLSGDWEYAPCAPEPEVKEPESDPEGEYCLWWSTVGDDSGPMDGVRYSTYENAEAACQLASHELHRRHRGQLLCGHGIARLVDGVWVQILEPDD